MKKPGRQAVPTARRCIVTKFGSVVTARELKREEVICYDVDDVRLSTIVIKTAKRLTGKRTNDSARKGK